MGENEKEDECKGRFHEGRLHCAFGEMVKLARGRQRQVRPLSLWLQPAFVEERGDVLVRLCLAETCLDEKAIILAARACQVRMLALSGYGEVGEDADRAPQKRFGFCRAVAGLKQPREVEEAGSAIGVLWTEAVLLNGQRSAE